MLMYILITRYVISSVKMLEITLFSENVWINDQDTVLKAENVSFTHT